MTEKTSEKIAGSKKHSQLVELIIRMWKEKPLGTVCAVITLMFVLVAIFAPLIAPYGMNAIHAKDALEGPSTRFWLGTDNLGRDLFSRIIFGARISVIVGLVATLISTAISTFLGIFSAYIGGTFDLILQRFIDAELSIPGLLINDWTEFVACNHCLGDFEWYRQYQNDKKSGYRCQRRHVY